MASQPLDAGWLDVGDGHEVYWEERGEPAGLPMLLLHGGPGSGVSEGTWSLFEGAGCRLIGIDQRGCGRSRPHAGDDLAALEHNTTAHLVADLERLRAHLGIERWALYGQSWGVTLGLVYAEAMPERVLGAILAGVTTTRRREIDWLYRGLAPLFPEEWDAFVAGAPAGTAETDLLAAYRRPLLSPDPSVHVPAARAFHAWDTASVSIAPQPKAEETAERLRTILGRARIVTHYFHHAAWLEDGQLLRDAGRLAGMPGWLVQGRLDLQGPLVTAWELAKAWPGSELRIVEGAGHSSGEVSMAAAIRSAVRDLRARYTTPGG